MFIVHCSYNAGKRLSRASTTIISPKIYAQIQYCEQAVRITAWIKENAEKVVLLPHLKKDPAFASPQSLH